MAGLLVSAHLFFAVYFVFLIVHMYVHVRVCIMGMHVCGDTGQCCVSSSVALHLIF